MERKIIKKYPEAVLESCGDRGHEKGCYLILNPEKGIVTHSEEQTVIIDYDKEGNIVGIDLVPR